MRRLATIARPPCSTRPTNEISTAFGSSAKDVSICLFCAPIGSAAHDAELPRRRIAWTPALLQPIRYKVIIRIHLSASGRRYMLPQGWPVGRLNDIIKGEKDVLDDSGYRRSMHRHGSHELRVRRHLIVSATLSGMPAHRRAGIPRSAAGSGFP
jgi:hypothetical protein